MHGRLASDCAVRTFNAGLHHPNSSCWVESLAKSFASCPVQSRIPLNSLFTLTTYSYFQFHTYECNIHNTWKARTERKPMCSSATVYKTEIRQRIISFCVIFDSNAWAEVQSGVMKLGTFSCKTTCSYVCILLHFLTTSCLQNLDFR